MEDKLESDRDNNNKQIPSLPISPSPSSSASTVELQDDRDVEARTSSDDDYSNILLKGGKDQNCEADHHHHLEENDNDVSQIQSTATAGNETGASSENCASHENSMTTEWLPGDIVWAHMTGYPWWPALIENDPIQKIYMKVNGKTKNSIRSYHVEFFGAAVLRGWVTSKSMIKFEGEDNYKARVAHLTAHAPKKLGIRSKLLSRYEVKPSQRSAWKESVVEAEDAMTYEREERRIRFGVDYFVDSSDETKTESKKSQTKKKRRRKNSDELNGNEPSSFTALKTSPFGHNSNHTLKDNHSASSDNAKPQKSKNTTKKDGKFSIFLQKHEQKVKEDHPNLNDAKVERFLRQQWEQMSVQQKARYRSRFDDKKSEAENKKTRTTLPPLSQASDVINQKRVYKPTKRFLEADMNNIYHTPRKSNRKKESKPVKDDIEEKSQEDNPMVYEEKLDADIVLEPESISCLQRTNSPMEVDLSEGCCPNVSVRSNGDTRIDKLCQVCEKLVDNSNSDYVKCDGLCCSTFHLACVKLKSVPRSSFTCKECDSGKHSCFICKNPSDDTRRCSVNQCGRFYHDECLKKFPASRSDSKGLVCPLHTCVSCMPETPWSSVFKGRLVRCLRCPTAYHNTDSCLAAGTEFITSNIILCPRHYATNQKQGVKQINVNWCFICSSGGSLICCESCPAAFHAECLNISPPEGNYYCRDCTVGRQPKYDDIVWVKLGCYRWWPAQIRHPKSVPDNIQAIKHQVGEFPVEFFGSHDYYWSNRSRVFLYQEGDKGSENASNRVLAKVYGKALQEATKAFQDWKQLKVGRNRLHEKPPPYKRIKTNKPIGKVQTFPVDVSNITPCECNAESENPCNSDSDCLNRMVMFECHSSVCPAGERCCNQRFQKREYVETIPFKTADKGWGLKTTTNIRKGQFVIEYVGELIDEEECRQRMASMHELNIPDYYFLTIDKDRIIDAGPKGNLARYMNHSCQPNCETQKWTVNGDTRVGLFAVCDIPAETELTFNYNLDCLGNEKRPCCCKAPNCSGFIGTRPKSATIISLEARKSKELPVKKKKKRKLSITEKIEHENKCFECGDGGQLIPCDKLNCPKTYHFNCVKRNKPSAGVAWECPWHTCDSCNAASVLLCHLCPSSFCPIHHANSITLLPGGRMLCNQHDAKELDEIETSTGTIKIDEVNHAVEEKQMNGENTETDDTVLKRKPGRPKKIVSTKEILEAESASSPRRGPGRPRKRKLEPDDETIPVKIRIGENSEDAKTQSDTSEFEKELLQETTQEVYKNLVDTVSPISALSAELEAISSSSATKQIASAEVIEKNVNKNDTSTVLRNGRPLQLTSKRIKTRVTCRVSGLTRKSTKSKNETKSNKNKTSKAKKVPIVINGKRVEDAISTDIRKDGVNGEEAATAIITVETDEVDGLELKPFVQKYKLENGEFSLEEYEDSEDGKNIEEH